MTLDQGTGEPDFDGLYACDIYHGWKLLEWKKGKWRIEGGVATWAAGAPKSWFGPLPEPEKYRNVEPKAQYRKLPAPINPAEFDL